MSENRPKLKRRHYFIDREFQLRYLLTFGIPMLLMLCFMIFTLYFATITAVDSAGRILRRNIESTIALSFQDGAAVSADHDHPVLENISNYIRTFPRSGAVRAELMPSLLGIFGVGLLLVILQIALLTIFFSHRVAGPAYRFERVLREVVAGRYTTTVTLRRSDELQPLAEALNAALLATRKRLQVLSGQGNEELRRKISSEIEV